MAIPLFLNNSAFVPQEHYVDAVMGLKIHACFSPQVKKTLDCNTNRKNLVCV